MITHADPSADWVIDQRGIIHPASGYAWLPRSYVWKPEPQPRPVRRRTYGMFVYMPHRKERNAA